MKNSGIKRIVSAIFIISLGGGVMLGLSGCFGKKYKVDYCGQKGSFEGAKDSYRAGERVELRFSHIATDTDYYFYVDGQRVNPGYDSDRHCYVISFTMPEQDVTVKYSSKNTMLYEPETEGKMLIDYYTATVGTNGGDCHYELVLSTYRDGMEKLEVFEGDDFEGGKKETCTAYLVPAEASSRCYQLIDNAKMRTWNDKYDDSAICGGVTAVKFLDDDGTYTRVSTDKMPDDGERRMGEIRALLSGYLKDEYLEKQPKS